MVLWEGRRAGMAGERREEPGQPERGEKSQDSQTEGEEPGWREGESMAEGEMRGVGKEG